MICLSCLKTVSRHNNAKLHLKPWSMPVLFGPLKPSLFITTSPITATLRHLSRSVPRYEERKEDLIPKKGGFAHAYDKFSTPETVPDQVEQSFPSLLKCSKFIDLGDPEGKVVTGTIIHVVEQDLYVDFGWKFHCVVSRPLKNEHEYVRGAKVRLILKDLELSSRFLGSEKDLTLLEADATLIGLVSSPAKAGSTLVDSNSIKS